MSAETIGSSAEATVARLDGQVQSLKAVAASTLNDIASLTQRFESQGRLVLRLPRRSAKPTSRWMRSSPTGRLPSRT